MDQRNEVGNGSGSLEEEQREVGGGLTLGDVGAMIRGTMDVLQDEYQVPSTSSNARYQDQRQSTESTLIDQDTTWNSLNSSAPGVEMDGALVPFVTLADFGYNDFPEDADAIFIDYFAEIVEDAPQLGAAEMEQQQQHGQDVDEEVNQEEGVDSNPVENEEPDVHAEPPADCTSEDDFFKTPCCTYRCNQEVDKDLIVSTRNSAKENDYTCPDHVNHLHLILIGQLSALTLEDGEKTTMTGQSKERERPLTQYMFRGKVICRKLYSFIYNCGKSRLRNLKKQVKDNGIEPKMHGKHGCRAQNATSIDRIKQFKTFMLNFCDANALVLPGRVPFHNALDPNVKLLPSSFTKTQVYKYYARECDNHISIWVFNKSWNTFFPNIIIQKPRTDLCPECYRNTISLSKLHGYSEEEKMAAIAKSQEHLQRVMVERNIYRDITQRVLDPLNLSRSLPCSLNGQMHYSMDFAQQIFLPHDSQQVGPLYFLTPYKVALFGVACEPIGKFVLYLIPESAASAGKGSNMVISLLHHFFETFGVGEEDAYIHADNCAGQNKNNFLMQYAVWRTMTGLHKKFKISFLPVGHTKFAPDLYFGIVKRAYRRSSVHSLLDLKKMLDEVCGKYIITFLVADEYGNMFTNVFDWQKHFKDHRAERLIGLLENYHFQCSFDKPGVIEYQKTTSSRLQCKQIFPADSVFQPTQLPNELPIERMSVARRMYLFEKIREYVRDDCKDILCPSVPEPEAIRLPSTSAQIPIDNVVNDEPVTPLFILPGAATQPQAHPPRVQKTRKASKCSYCNQEGHTNRIGKNNVPICPRRRAGLPRIGTEEEQGNEEQ